MKLIGKRILISEVEKEEKAFATAEATLDFIAKGKVEETDSDLVKIGYIVRVSKLAGEEFEENGKRMKIIKEDDVMAIDN